MPACATEPAGRHVTGRPAALTRDIRPRGLAQEVAADPRSDAHLRHMGRESVNTNPLDQIQAGYKHSGARCLPPQKMRPGCGCCPPAPAAPCLPGWPPDSSCHAPRAAHHTPGA